MLSFVRKWFVELHKKANEQWLPDSRQFSRSNITIMVLSVLGIFAFLLFSVFLARRMSLLVPTYHMDGAFQTASGLFRLQNGEIPGRDFFPYLGILPICLCYPVFVLTGGHVTASVFASHFTVLFCCMLSFGTIHFLISKRKHFLYSISWGAALVIIFYLMYMSFPSMESTFEISQMLFPGNSLRPIRQFAPYLCVIVLYFLYRDVNNVPAVVLYLGALWTSLFSLWSNDYGLGTTLFSFAGGLIWILTSERNDRCRCLLTFSVVYVCGIVFFYELATLGHMGSLILYNFRDVAKDQYWYFATPDEGSLVYSFNSFWRMFRTCQADLVLPFVASLILLIDSVFFKSFGKFCLLLIGCILFSGGLIASVGGHIASYFHYFYCWGLGVVIFYVISLTSFLKYKNARIVICVFLLLAVAIYGCKSEVIRYQKAANNVKNNRSYFFDDSLGGYLDVSWKPYLAFLDENRNSTFVEEYFGIASAYLHRNSDWKVDSVIHAFNKTRDDSSKKILNKDYIITSSSSIHWTFWGLAQNYWFYEAVLHNFDFCFSVPNCVFVWKKRETPHVFEDVDICHLIGPESFQIDSPGMYEINLGYDYVPRFHSLLVLRNPLGLVIHSLSLPPYQNQYRFLLSCDKPQVFSLESICNPGTFQIKSIQAKKVPDSVEDKYDLWHAFYLSDINWERGYFKRGGGFFVLNTKENREKFLVGMFVLLPDGSKREIIRQSINSIYLNVFTEGDSFVSDLFPHQLKRQINFDSFYLTDKNWERGYYRRSGGFFVENTEENKEKFAVGASVLLPDGSKREITSTIESLNRYYNVYTKGESFVADLYPHQLGVIDTRDFYLTDSNWERGYYRKSGGFFVENTEENREKFAVGASVLLPDGSKREIIRTSDRTRYLNVYTNGEPFVTDLLPHQLDVINWKDFYLTDKNWERGYYRRSGGFFVENTEENREKFAVGASVLLPDGSKREITSTIESLNRYFNVFTKGESFVTDLYPHQLNVVPPQ